MTPPTLPVPPLPFPVRDNRLVIAASTLLHRTHSDALRPNQFNPCLGQPTRFAPILGGGGCVPSLYAALSEEAAAFESIFHDIEPSAPFKTVRQDTVERRRVSQIAPTRALELVPLFAPDLKAWGLSRADVIETPKSTYPQTAAWAQAIHAAYGSVDGLAWTSRQCDPIVCLLLFGDRVGEPDLDAVSQVSASEPTVLARLRGYAQRADITIVC